MGPESVSLWLAILALLISFDAIFGGIYLFKAGKFCRRFAIAIAIYVFAVVVGHHANIADYLYNNLQYALLIATVVVIFISLYDMVKIVTKNDRGSAKHRHHNASHAPTRH